MKRQAKTLISALLALILTFSFSACQTTISGDELDSSETLNILESAVKKTKEAKSLHIKGRHIYTYVAYAEETAVIGVKPAAGQRDESISNNKGNSGYSGKMTVEYAQDVSVKDDGAYKSVLSGTTKDESRRKKTTSKFNAYYNGNCGYQYDSVYQNSYKQFVSDKPLDSGIVFDRIYGNYKDGMISRFCKLKPSLKNDLSGNSVYCLSELTYAQFLEVFKGEVQYNEMVSKDTSKYTISVTVDANGFLSALAYSSSDGGVINECVFSHFNEDISIEKPEWVDRMLGNQESNVLHHIGNDFDAEYRICRDDKTEEMILQLIEIHRPIWGNDELTSTYIVPKEINEIKVKEIGLFNYNDYYGIEKVVVSTGIGISTHAFMPNTTLFFEDTREALEGLGSSKLQIASDTPSETTTGDDVLNEDDGYDVVISSTNMFMINGVLVKGAYYAGEWEMVDGVPTPKK